MVGRPSPQSPSISRLTSPPDQILSKCRRSRHQIPTPLATAPLARNEKIDFAFLDGQHTFDYVLVDFFYVDKLLSVGGIIVFDDLQYPSVRKVCRYVLTNLCYVSTEPKIADTRLRSRMISTLAKAGPIAKAVRPEIRERDGALGIPNQRFMAVQKKAHDLIGEGPNTTRHWEAHNAF